ncbi:MAG: hypothetical protein HUJ54_13135 [Erysipelotrichaceae bacterium]|nr:hypothetical protein [Erysipelotrichaceae bacterium]
MKNLTALVCTALMGLSLAACSANAAHTDYSNSTVTGQVKSVEGSKVTVQIGNIENTTIDQILPEAKDVEVADKEKANEAVMFTATTQEATFTLDHPEIKVKSHSGTTDGTEADLEEFRVITLDVGKDNTVKTVTVDETVNVVKGA